MRTLPDPKSPLPGARPVEVPRADYLLWAKRRPHPAVDLGRSDVVACTLADLPGAREALELTGRNDEGWEPLVGRVAARYGVRPDQVATATGTSGANFLVCAALLRPGDDVLVERPAYDPLLAVPVMLGASLVRFERRFEDGFRLDLDRVESAITQRTRLIILTNPHNPTGVLTGAGDLERLGRLAERHGCYVLADEVYLDAVFGAKPAAAATLSPRIITTASLTKAYGLSGLRCGWALGDPMICEEIRRARDLVDGTGSVLAERAAAIAFEALPALEARARAILAPNFERFEAFMAGQPALEWVVPPGGTVAFPRLRATVSADAFTDRLLREFDTTVVPGRFFEAPAHFRVALGIHAEVLERGLHAIAQALGHEGEAARQGGLRPRAEQARR
jgi:aspartate/methionine/tyrosine aminotransferase